MHNFDRGGAAIAVHHRLPAQAHQASLMSARQPRCCAPDLLHDVVHQLQALDCRGGSMAQLLPLDSDVPDQVSIPPLPGLACLSPEIRRFSELKNEFARGRPQST